MKKIFAVLLILVLGDMALAQSRSGIYELNPGQTVVIVDKPRSINFDIGGTVGDDDYNLRGTAKLIRKNVYEYRKIIRGKVDNSLCRIRFTFSGKILTVKEDLDCLNYRGVMISLDGDYEKSNE